MTLMNGAFLSPIKEQEPFPLPSAILDDVTSVSRSGTGSCSLIGARKTLPMSRISGQKCGRSPLAQVDQSESSVIRSIFRSWEIPSLLWQMCLNMPGGHGKATWNVRGHGKHAWNARGMINMSGMLLHKWVPKAWSRVKCQRSEVKGKGQGSRSKDKCHRSGLRVKGQRSRVKCQGSKVNDQRSDVKGQRQGSTIKGQGSKVKGQMSRSNDKGQRSSQRSRAKGQRPSVGGHGSKVKDQRSRVKYQKVKGQRSKV